MQLSDIRSRIQGRLEWPTAGDPNSTSLCNAAINEGQRLFAFLTLCLETTKTFILTPGIQFYHMLAEGNSWADWIVPLRLVISNDTTSGADSRFDEGQFDSFMPNDQAPSGLVTVSKPKLRAASIYEMAAANDNWIGASGTPTQYGCLGWDLLFFDQTTPNTRQGVNITYARSSLTLVKDGDAPELHKTDHEGLIDYGLWRLRANEGGQELISAKPLFDNFLDRAKQRADEVRARSLARRYDRQPFELEGFDYSRILTNRPDLPPGRKENRWTSQA